MKSTNSSEIFGAIRLCRSANSVPLHRQLYESLRQAILSGKLSAGCRLPASRTLAVALSLSRNVVLLAYDQLRAEGYVESRVGAGTFVAAELPGVSSSENSSHTASPAVRPPALSAYARRVRALPLASSTTAAAAIDFRFGAVASDAHSMRIWRRLLNRHAERLLMSDTAVQGYPPLRQAIASYVGRSRGITCSADQIVVVNGTQQALDLVARIFLDPGDQVILEEPHYLGAREVFMAAGAKLLAYPTDDDGLVTERLRGACARLAYVTPSHQFPTGAVLPAARRLALLDWARNAGAYVVEDDYDSEYRYAGRPLEPVAALDQDQLTIYLGTFSKQLFPALRLGFLVLPPPLIEPFRATKYLADRHSAMLNQAVLADFISEGHFERHLRRMRAANGKRRAMLLAALNRELGRAVTITGNNAGVHLALWLPGVSPLAVDTIVTEARTAGVGVYSCNPSFYGPPSRAGLLLGYETLDEAQIDAGVMRLAGVLRHYL